MYDIELSDVNTDQLIQYEEELDVKDMTDDQLEQYDVDMILLDISGMNDYELQKFFEKHDEIGNEMLNRTCKRKYDKTYDFSRTMSDYEMDVLL